MKIGIISDIHNNKLALKAALEEFKKRNCEMIICAGDIIGIGPDPVETVEMLMEISDFVAVKGNHESYINNLDKNLMGHSEYEYHLWEHEKLSEKARSFLSTLEESRIIELGDKRLLITHYPDLAALENDFILDFKGHELDKCFINCTADVVIFGHTHKSTHLVTDSRHYINPGSLGCHNHNKLAASAGVLTVEDTISYEQIEIDYEISMVTEKIKQLQYPAYVEILNYFFNI